MALIDLDAVKDWCDSVHPDRIALMQYTKLSEADMNMLIKKGVIVEEKGLMVWKGGTGESMESEPEPKPEKTKSVESLNKVTTEKKREDIRMVKGDVSYKSLVTCAINAGITDDGLKDYAIPKYEKAGVSHAKSVTRASAFAGYIKKLGGLETVAKKYDITIDDKVAESPKEKGAAPGTGEKLTAPKPKEGSFFTYGDAALAVQTHQIKKDGWLDFITDIYERAGLNAEEARKRAYQFKAYAKKHGIAKLAKEGSLERIRQYLPKGAQESVEDMVDRTPEQVVLPATFLPAAEKHEYGIIPICKEIGGDLEKLIEGGVLSQQQAIAIVDVVKKTAYEVGIQYVAKEMERFSKVKETLNKLAPNK